MTLRTNFENKVSDKTKFGVNSSIGFSKSNFIDSENGIALQNPAAAVYLAAHTKVYTTTMGLIK